MCIGYWWGSPLRGPHRWVDNIKMDLGEIVWLRMGSCECGIVPLGSINCWEVLE
jgi:hypothetical protein